MLRPPRFNRYLYIRLAFLVLILVAVLVLHARGSTLVLLRVSRIALIALLLLGGGALARRRGR
jgi:hypothetical protein